MSVKPGGDERVITSWRIGGGPCPKCGSCDTYCADCIYPRLSALEAVADAARTVARGAWHKLDAALDALDILDKEQER